MIVIVIFDSCDKVKSNPMALLIYITYRFGVEKTIIHAADIFAAILEAITPSESEFALQAHMSPKASLKDIHGDYWICILTKMKAEIGVVCLTW